MKHVFPLKRIAPVLLVLIAVSPLLAQQRLAHDWIVPAQRYFKIPVVKAGLYRLSTSDLQRAGLPAALDPQTLQLFYRGQEVPVFVAGESDGKLDAGDYLEFLGKAADGTLDSALYYPRAAQPHRYYSLFSDTTAYFLTYRPNGSKGLRVATQPEISPQNLTPEPYYWEETFRLYTGDYAVGTFYPLGIRNYTAAFFTHHDWGEGYTGGAFKPNDVALFSFGLDFFVKTNEATPQLDFLVVGRNPDSHRVQVALGPKTGLERGLDTLNFTDYRPYTFQQALRWDDLAPDGSLTLSLLTRESYPSTGPGKLQWAFSPSYIRLRYPRQPTFQGRDELRLGLRPSPAAPSRIDLTFAPENALVYDLTDENRPQRVPTTRSGSTLRVVLPASASGRRLLVTAQVLSPLAIRPVSFRALPAKAAYLMVSHEGLMKPAAGAPDAVRAYAAYRASVAGGGYDTLVMTMNQLVDQFNYGEWSPVAIRNFAEAMRLRAGAQYLLLLGQSRWAQEVRRRPDRYTLDPVPNAGWPSADMPLVMPLSGSAPFAPTLGLGRLNAATPQHVADYLAKVKEYEAGANDAFWRKRLLHLSGGKSAGELALFKSNVDGFKRIAEGGRVGVSVQTITKKTDEPVEVVNLAQQLNEGVGIVTFFGHSGGDVTDIDIGFCSNEALGYRNQGRYPLLLINGCDAGDIFYDGGQKTFTTDWVNTPNRGAILALAQAWAGYPLPLRTYSDQLYRTLFTDSTFTGKPFGAVMRETIRRVTTASSAGYFEIGHAQQFMLQGDPAVVLFPATKTDYALDNASLSLQATGNQRLVASSDSFRLGVVLRNLGLLPRQRARLSIQRTLANGTVLDYGSFDFAPVAFQDTLFFTLRNDKTNGGGPNRFEVLVDPERRLDESTRDNNRALLDVVIPGFAATPLFPSEFGVVNTLENGLPNVTLTAQSTQVLSKNGAVVPQNFLLEIDTTNAFNSPFKRSLSTAATWLPSLKVSLLAADSTTYYWRIREADRPLSNDNGWAESSFLFLKNTPDGWAQTRPPQLARSRAEALTLTGSQWQFQTSQLQLRGQIAGASAGPEAHRLTEIFLNNAPLVGNGNCFEDALVAVAFNPATLQPQSVLGAQQCGYSPFVANFLPDEQLRNGLFQSYLAGLPANSFVLLSSVGTLSYRRWPAALYAQLARLGADTARLARLPDGAAYLLLGQLNGGKPRLELRADTPAQTLAFGPYALSDSYRQATVTSPLIGPALGWNRLAHRSDLPLGTAARLDVLGVSLAGTETPLLSNLTVNTLNLSAVDAKKYPYLRLRLRLSTEAVGPPPQLRGWLLSYQGVPEGAVDPTANAAETSTQRAEGEAFSQKATFRNLSNRAFGDSLTVRQTLANREARRQTTRQWRVAPPPPGGSVTVEGNFQTLGNAGENTVSLAFNPQVLPELYFQNNTADVLVNVLPDRANPVLEVTFDGRQIADGELVSASPLLGIRLKDENRFLLRQDTSGIDLRWQRPGPRPVWERLAFSNPALRYTLLPDNDFRATFSPKKLPDGRYAFQAQGRDATGNDAGSLPYQIHFQVKNGDTLALSTYPNPLVAFTRFALTLGGDAPPASLRVRLYAPQGTLVRTLTVASPRVGVNEIFWDGTDSSGTALPAGLYLYQVSPGENKLELSGKVLIVR